MLPVKLINAEGKVVLEGEHVHTIPGSRPPTKKEMAEYYGIKTRFHKDFDVACRVAGVNRYVLRPKGETGYIVVPMTGRFKLEIVQ